MAGGEFFWGRDGAGGVRREERKIQRGVDEERDCGLMKKRKGDDTVEEGRKKY